MKRMKVFLSLVCAFAVLAVAGCTGGCKTDLAKTTYVTSGVTHITASTALSGWNEYLGREYAAVDLLAEREPEKAAQRKEKLLEQERAVKAAYDKYRAAQVTVLTAAQEFSKIPPNDPNAPVAQDRLTAAVAAASATLAQVIGLLEQFGVKVK